MSTVRLAATDLISALMRTMSSRPMPGHRLVEQQKLGLERERGGDFERALAAVRQLDRQRLDVRRKPDIGDQRIRLIVETRERALRAPEIE